MDAALGLQIAVSVAAGAGQRGALDTRLFTIGAFEDVGAVSALLGPAQIHPQEYLRPVLGLGTAGAGMDGHDSRALIIGTTEREPGFEGVQLLVQTPQVHGDLGDDLLIRLRRSQLV